MSTKGISKVANFRFARQGERILLTNDIGEYAFVSGREFNLLIEGGLNKSAADKFIELSRKNFIRNKVNLPLLVNRFAQKHFVGKGAELHIVVLTLRCDHKCSYCQASAASLDDFDYDMTLSTADKVVDRIFESPSKNIMIEFQGGEPLLNFKVLQHIVKRAKQKNNRTKRIMDFSIVTNLTFMDEKKFAFLFKNRIQVCSSLDGPAKVHNAQRICRKNNSYQNTVSWLRKLLDKYSQRKDYPAPGALLTITRMSLPYPRQIVDEYLSLGIKNLHLRWINPFGMSIKSWDKLRYSSQQFISFYFKALDYIIELNKKGSYCTERTAVIFLQKIFSANDPNYLDLRSPCGAGIGQLAYNYNGDVYCCDEGRMFSRMGDDSFKIGSVSGQTYDDFIGHPVVQAVCTASCLEVIPGCSECVFKPYCGTCPVYNYAVNNDASRNVAFTCDIKKNILWYLFEKMEDSENKEIFLKWTGIKERR